MGIKIDGLEQSLNYLHLQVNEINKNTQLSMNRVVIKVKEEIQKVILEYSNGTLSRGIEYKGKRKPLLDTGKLLKTWNFEVQATNDRVTGIIMSGTHYSGYLDSGTSRIVAFNFIQIAIERVMKDIYREFGSV